MKFVLLSSFVLFMAVVNYAFSALPQTDFTCRSFEVSEGGQIIVREMPAKNETTRTQWPAGSISDTESRSLLSRTVTGGSC